MHHTVEHTLHIAIHHGHGLAESDAGDRCGRVPADSRQLSQLIRGGRKRATGGNFFCSLMQRARPAVISQSAPRREHGLFPGAGQALDRRKLRYKLPVAA
jgi:hypothetical protein